MLLIFVILQVLYLMNQVSGQNLKVSMKSLTCVKFRKLGEASVSADKILTHAQLATLSS